MVDSNIWMDIFNQDPKWYPWSYEMLSNYIDKTGKVFINPIILAEISIVFASLNELKNALKESNAKVKCLALPMEASFRAGKAFLQYKKNGGSKLLPLPDFFIGAHALVKNMILLTRDVNPYKAYFPALSLITP